jgi:glycosyltransferase involved in cell wall biosynthesis
MVKEKDLNCLWLARKIPLPLNSGETNYTAHLAQALALAGSAVTFIGLDNPIAPAMRLAEAFEKRIDWSIAPGLPNPIILALASPLPLVAARYGTRQYARYLIGTLCVGDFDAIILDQYSMVWAIPHLRKAKWKREGPVIAHIAHDFETDVTSDIARNFRGSPFRKAALYLNARKTAIAEHKLARAANIIVTLTAEDAESFARLSSSSTRLVLAPGYDGPRAPERPIVAGTSRRVAVVGNYHWVAKQMNLTDFLEAADPIFESAGIGLDIVGEIPDHLRKACAARVKATRFHGFVDNLGEFLAARRMGLVVEETGGGFKLKVLDYIFNRLPIAAIKGSMAGLPLTAGRDYLCFESMQELARGVAAAIDDVERLNSMQRTAYANCEKSFDWGDRGRILYDAIRQAVDRQS